MEFPSIWVSYFLVIRVTIHICGRKTIGMMQVAYTVSVCSITDIAYFDPSVRVESARLLHCRSSLFLFVMNKYFGGSCFETM